MVERFLVTTADENTWPDNEPVLFLGEWCRLYSRKDKWSEMDAQVLPYHWDDRQKLDSDFHYLIKLHETLLIEVCQKLNEIHAVSHSVRYWRILIGSWLGYFTQILFDRWSSLKQVEEHYDLSGTIILKGEEDNLVPNDMNTFTAFFLEDKWNHHIYSLILQNSTGINCVEKERKSTTIKIDRFQPPSVKALLKTKFRKFISGSLKLLQRNTDAFFITTYLSFRDELKLYFHLKQFPQLRERIQPQNIETNLNQRKWILSGISLNEFEVLARSVIPQQLPRIFLEGYTVLIRQTESLNWPVQPNAIFTSNAHHSDDIFNAWAAQKVENGTKLLIGQHGGYYGIGKWSFIEEHELAISDSFLSWGWADKNKPKVRPVGMLKKKSPLNIDHVSKPHILLVEHINPRQSYHLFSSTLSSQWLDYLDEQFKFVESLPQILKEALIVRLHPHDWGWAPFRRWKDRFPTLRIDRGDSDIKDSLVVSRIYVSTYNATTFLESLAMDVPTVIFWNSNHWELRSSAIPYFEELKRVGVFHETPESAANHVSEVWDDINGWWERKDVREVLNSFKKNYCNTPANLIQNLENTFRALSQQSE
jgi:putative transferase (TIGR04331 family)